MKTLFLSALVLLLSIIFYKLKFTFTVVRGTTSPRHCGRCSPTKTVPFRLGQKDCSHNAAGLAAPEEQPVDRNFQSKVIKFTSFSAKINETFTRFQTLSQAGVIDHLRSLYFPKQGMCSMPENGNSKPTILRLTQLTDCFYFLGIGALLSLLIFLVTLIRHTFNC